ncbi:MAG: metallophosphoesterase [Solobacterium sp.]|nr:metallophosphoesterase [Solobacterium sp.]
MDNPKLRIIRRILIVLGMICLLSLALLYDAYYKAPSRYQVRYENLESVFIPDQMNDVSILFFSDLDYGTFMDEARLTKLTDSINALSPDVIVFGGDLFDQNATDTGPNAASAIIRCLSQLEAPLGKYAVLGDFDYRTPELRQQVEDILFQSDFELLLNSSVLIRNHGSGSVTLTGLDCGLYGYPDSDAAFANVGRTVYNIVIAHTPDQCELLPNDLTNYVLCGHSHGGQAYWGFGALYTPSMAERYFRGKHTIQNTYTLDISNGVGTTIKDVRFLSNAEIVLYRLKHKAMTD